jgi:hypothetical protein
MAPLLTTLIALVDAYLELAKGAEEAAKRTSDQEIVRFHVGRAAGLREAAEALKRTITEAGSDVYA